MPGPVSLTRVTVDRADLGRVLVLIPAYNEQACIEATIDDVRRAVPEAHVLVIDDASTDATPELAARASATVHSLPSNLGSGGAMREGYRYAAAAGYDSAVRVDADGQHDAIDIPALLAQLSLGADLVVGSRFAGIQGYSVGVARRWAINRLSRQITSLTASSFSDPTSGFRATNRRAIELFAEQSDPRFLGDTVDALITAVASGLVVVEVPVRMRRRQGGRPSIDPITSALGFISTSRSLDRAAAHRSTIPIRLIDPIGTVR